MKYAKTLLTPELSDRYHY